MAKQILAETHLGAFKRYLLREEKSAATVEKYLRDARAFMIFAKEKTMSKELTISYKCALEKAGYKPRSINSMLASLNCFLEFIKAEDCKVKTVRIQKPTYLTEEKELTRANTTVHSSQIPSFFPSILRRRKALRKAICE